MMCATVSDPSLQTRPSLPRVAGGGRGVKPGPGDHASMLTLADVGRTTDRRVLGDPETGDDAAAVRRGDDLLTVRTVDFFPPVVDDAEKCGAVVALNAMSDVLAMGGRVVSALAAMMLPEGSELGTPSAIPLGAADPPGEADGSPAGGRRFTGPQSSFGLLEVRG